MSTKVKSLEALGLVVCISFARELTRKKCFMTVVNVHFLEQETERYH
jgi:hypothetical protein